MMTPEPFSSARARIRPQAAALTALCGAATAIGSVLTWISATPALPNSHYLNPANLPWADLRAGAWLTITGAALGLVSAFWLRRRPAG